MGSRFPGSQDVRSGSVRPHDHIFTSTLGYIHTRAGCQVAAGILLRLKCLANLQIEPSQINISNWSN